MNAGRPTRASEAFFGRRHGKSIRPVQAAALQSLLPRYALDLDTPPPADLRDLFEADVEAVRLEIGFGGGEHLLAEAGRLPATGFIGVEPFVNGMAKLMAALENEPARQSARLWRRRHASCSTACPRPRSRPSTCSIPTHGQRSATGSGASSTASISTASPAC